MVTSLTMALDATAAGANASRSQCHRADVMEGDRLTTAAGESMTRHNLIPDVTGIRVGNADDARLASGVTAILFDEPAVAAVAVRGRAPGTLHTDRADP